MRRSQPPALAPQHRITDGVLYVGADPWFECSFCGSLFDTGEFEGCPVCAIVAAQTDYEHRAALAAWAQSLTPVTH